MTTFNIGDYIEYLDEYYNGRGYSRSVNRGCVISKNTAGRYCNIIKQYGGQIWYGVKPIGQITEDEFLSKFSIYDEHKDFLLKSINVLPPRIQPIIINKTEEKLNKQVKSMILFCLKSKINYKLLYPETCNIQIDTEVWSIKWYIINVLRKYEPFKIKQTLDLCCGKTQLIKEFMFNNIDFMVSMQFQPYNLECIMHILIQEKWLEFIYEKKLINSAEYSARRFPITIKKLEVFLELKKPIIDDIKLEIYMYKDKHNYKLETSLVDIHDTKFVFKTQSNRYTSNPKSKCCNTTNINLNTDKNGGWKQIPKIPCKMSRIEHPNFIEKIHNDPSSFYLNSQKNILIKQHHYSLGTCNVLYFNLFCVKSQSLLGQFEFNTNDYDFGCIFLEDVRKV